MISASLAIATVLLTSEDIPARPQATIITELKAGNARFVSGQATGLHRDSARREHLGLGQKPDVIVLGCADSRVPPELIFDQGLGDLFVLRVAGNVVDSPVLASIEYAVEHLGASVIVVLGHERCGAVKAAVDDFKARHRADLASPKSDAHDGDHGHIPELIKLIEPAVRSTFGQPGDGLAHAIEANALQSANLLTQRSSVLRKAALAGKVVIEAGVYDLDSGEIGWLKVPAITGGFARVVGG